jgi:NADPH:quinone reductase
VLAAWYERPGQASDVLQVGEMPDPPWSGRGAGPDDALRRDPGDTKKRADWTGNGMPFPRVVPHSDGSGVIDAVGRGVQAERGGRRVWVYGARSYRSFGTAA